MDTLRGNFPFDSDDLGDAGYYEPIEDEIGRETPPSPVGQDERRMQVRAYNFWANLLIDRNYPAIEELHPAELEDFGPYSVLLDFSTGIENPGITYLGDKLAEECGADSSIRHLDEVPSRSLLSRITDHYMQILANQAPIGFEAEFVNQLGRTILYRGILLPFSSDDDTIDFIYGVINWKELADQFTTDELMLEIDQALDESENTSSPLSQKPARLDLEEADDLPPTDGDILDLSEAMLADDDTEECIPSPGFGMDFSHLAPDEDDEEDDGETGGYDFGHDGSENEAVAFTHSSGLTPMRNPESGPGTEEFGDDDDETAFSEDFASLTAGIDGDLAEGDADGEHAHEDSDGEADADDPYAIDLGTEVADFETSDETDAFEADETAADPAQAQPAEEEAPFELTAASEVVHHPASDIAADVESLPAAEPDRQIAVAELGEGEMELGDWLASARELAEAANSSEDRTRQALYAAISKAYDFSVVAADEPEQFEELLTDSGLTMQDRAPMTPVVKLVFGATYDKTRLTEYAAALSHGHRLGVAKGDLGGFLSGFDGGLKGVVKAERRLRREESGKPVEPEGAPRESLARKLRKLEPQGFDAIPADGAEFALVMVRRMPDGTLAVLGEIPDDVALVERAARKLLG